MVESISSGALALTGQTAIVTGAGMGIGRSIARCLAAAGAAVAVADRNGGAAWDCAEELVDRGWEARALVVDVADEIEVLALVDAVVAWRGGIDLLVNNAGDSSAVPVLDMTEEDFQRVLEVDLTGVFLCSRSVARHMVERGRGGRIVNVTSTGALHPTAVGMAHHDAAKHGSWGFTRSLALELAPHGIIVDAIAPGAVATPGRSHRGWSGGLHDHVPMRRLAAPGEIAAVTHFIASDLASYLTGSQVVVDGGALLM
ncbi:MAG TPA: SDR family NAD(P)-dependent oxidoreductase [Nocardioides sp.]|uniref:SDR family NAD(P)-dependent oxidoreductase n=1 Tax=Nocardioides sp. TaxID=35761 RepID=UPI002CA05F07|nr:SDR family NAD(P)-dependent oxidoreductase [Nocardioides sp.]HTW13865.1 SDR family NAD(P)-dependent oxidoreductase [Nocardioides sp.]